MRLFILIGLLGCSSTKPTPATPATTTKAPSCDRAAVSYATVAVGRAAQNSPEIPDVGVRLYEPIRNVVGRRLLSAVARHLGGVIWVVEWDLVALKDSSQG